METTIPLVIAAATVVLMGLGAVWDDRRTRARRKEIVEEPVIDLPLLHSINDDRCIGCEACVDVCPTEVLDLRNHKVVVARFDDCVQCEQCANACPTTALVMYREGTAPRTLTVPELDDHFQTGVPGQFLIGEVAGKPLVKNAANLGRAVVEHIKHELRATPGPGGDVLDVAIVGSGPGGLSAGLTCLKHQLSVVVLEKEHVISSTVSRYPKGKHFMAEPATVPNLSLLPVFDASKEDLVGAWQKVVAAVKLPVKLGEAVETVKRGDDGIFTVKTTVATYKARAVVLATGLRGKPRLLAVPGANLEKIASRLDDPAEFAAQHVLVVGGGDSAVEAAVSLADVGATVTLSYRGDGFKRCKQGNQKRLAEYQAAGTISVLLESNVLEFTADEVSIKLKDGTVTKLRNQASFVLIGADTPVAWLEANNVRFVEREHLYALGSTEDAVRKVAPDALPCPTSADEAIVNLLGVAPGRPAAKPPARKESSVVAQIRDELKTAVTELTGVFRLPAPEQAHAGAGPARRSKTPVPPRPRKLRTDEHVVSREPALFPSRDLVIRPSRGRTGATGGQPTLARRAPGDAGERTPTEVRAYGGAGDRTATDARVLGAAPDRTATDARVLGATADRTATDARVLGAAPDRTSTDARVLGAASDRTATDARALGAAPDRTATDARALGAASDRTAADTPALLGAASDRTAADTPALLGAGRRTSGTHAPFQEHAPTSAVVATGQAPRGNDASGDADGGKTTVAAQAYRGGRGPAKPR